MKEIKDYLHLYLGCEIEFGYKEKKYRGWLRGKSDKTGWECERRSPSIFAPLLYVKAELIKPILRPLSDMTEEEYNEKESFVHKFSGKDIGADGKGVYSNPYMVRSFFCKLEAEKVNYLLSKQFDLFGLIEAGIAIDKTTLK